MASDSVQDRFPGMYPDRFRDRIPAQVSARVTGRRWVMESAQALGQAMERRWVMGSDSVQDMSRGSCPDKFRDTTPAMASERR